MNKEEVKIKPVRAWAALDLQGQIDERFITMAKVNGFDFIEVIITPVPKDNPSMHACDHKTVYYSQHTDGQYVCMKCGHVLSPCLWNFGSY